jgi:hypothetical protein
LLYRIPCGMINKGAVSSWRVGPWLAATARSNVSLSAAGHGSWRTPRDVRKPAVPSGNAEEPGSAKTISIRVSSPIRFMTRTGAWPR